jgi:hypothetical protein
LKLRHEVSRIFKLIFIRMWGNEGTLLKAVPHILEVWMDLGKISASVVIYSVLRSQPKTSSNNYNWILMSIILVFLNPLSLLNSCSETKFLFVSIDILAISQGGPWQSITKAIRWYSSLFCIGENVGMCSNVWVTEEWGLWNYPR